jgi:hypothetical protein
MITKVTCEMLYDYRGYIHVTQPWNLNKHS